MDFDSYAQPIIDFVRVHSVWAAPVVFVLCFAELLAFISLLIPAWAALVGIGTLIGASGLNFWPIWIAGSLGAALGDWLSYWIGLKLETRVYHMWPLSRNPEMIPKGEEFVKKWGALGDLHRPLLRAIARDRPADRRHFRDAVVELPDRQLHFGLRVVRGPADARRRDVEAHQVDRRSAGLKKLCRDLVPAEPMSVTFDLT